MKPSDERQACWRQPTTRCVHKPSHAWHAHATVRPRSPISYGWLGACMWQLDCACCRQALLHCWCHACSTAVPPHHAASPGRLAWLAPHLASVLLPDTAPPAACVWPLLLTTLHHVLYIAPCIVPLWLPPGANIAAAAGTHACCQVVACFKNLCITI
jgi:hypothetical protein